MNPKNLSVKLLLLSFILLAIVFSQSTLAQTRSRILGVVKDSQSKETLVGVTVMVKGTNLGAATDLDGKFIIINVPVGTYEMQISMIGYTAKTLRGVVVSADRVTSLDILLDPTTVQGQEVVVTAKADELHKEVSNTQMVVSSTQLQDASGVRQINAFLAKMPGVSESNGFLTIRGGSADQTGTMVNGLSYNNAAVGNAETSVPMSAIEQISLLSGGYNAEYGNFRSGLINITTKSGSKDKYEGTFSLSKNENKMHRFGQSFYDVHNDALRSYLDPNIAFVGTAAAWPNAEQTSNDAYMRQQNPVFSGWISQAKAYNNGKPVNLQATPMDMYLLACWLQMVEPDYNSLASLPGDLKTQIGYREVSDEQKRLFTSHHMKEESADFNFDGGFGGPLPFIGKALGDATFYIANTSSEQHYIMPVSLSSQKSYTTLGTIKAMPMENLSITYNVLWKRQIGVSPVRPAFGDAPDASSAGGFMSTNNVRNVASNYVYWYDPGFFPILNQTTLMNGVTINHVLNKSTYWELSLSYLSIQDSSPNGDNRDTTAITKIGPFPVNEIPYGKLQFGSRKVQGFGMFTSLPGMQFAYMAKEGDLYDNSKVRQYRAKFDIASQINENNFIKGGVEYNYIDLQHDYWEKWNNNAYNTYEFNYHRKPTQTALYVQDQINYNEIVANIGVRMDYYYGGGGTWPTGDPFNEAMFKPQKVDTSLYRYLGNGKSYIWDTWSAYNDTTGGKFLQPIKNYLAISPRIGISFPITTESKFYFNYGHFRSNPPYYTMFQFRYRYDKNGLYDMSNPNLEPPRTISYELGVAYNFFDNYILTISGYSKDVTGEAGTVSYRNSAGTVNYSNQANNQYQDIQGLEINVTKNDNSWITGWINFNYMLKKRGNTGRSTITDVTINNDQVGLYAGNESKTLPQPQLNANITFVSPEDFGPKVFGSNIFSGWNLTLFGSYVAGSYFTYNPLGLLHYTNNLQYPDYYMLDLKLSKAFKIGGVSASFYVDVSNLLNLTVSQMSSGYDFQDATDRNNYLKSLHLPLYDSPTYDKLRAANAGSYIAGNDKVGDLRSDDKPYINDPNWSFFNYKQPRDIWFGLRVDF